MVDILKWKVGIGQENRERDFYLWDAPVIHEMVEDIFTGHCYPYFRAGEWIVDHTPKVIIDAGANIGAAAVFFWFQVPTATIHCYEPSSRTRDLFHRNVKGIENIHLHECALSDFDGIETLKHSSLGPVADGFDGCKYNATVSSEQVEVRDAATEMRRLGIEEIDIIKIDTEGCEVPILESLLAAEMYPKWIFLEFHHEDDRRTIDEMLRPTHKWFTGRLQNSHHRGEMVFLRNDLIKPIVDELAITPRRRKVLA